MSDSCNPLAYGPMDYGDYSPHGLFFCLWNSPSRNTWLGCHFILQGIFSIQESNPGLLHCRQNLYWLSYEGNRKNQLYSNQKKKKKKKKRPLECPHLIKIIYQKQYYLFGGITTKDQRKQEWWFLSYHHLLGLSYVDRGLLETIFD